MSSPVHAVLDRMAAFSDAVRRLESSTEAPIATSSTSASAGRISAYGISCAGTTAGVTSRSLRVFDGTDSRRQRDLGRPRRCSSSRRRYNAQTMTTPGAAVAPGAAAGGDAHHSSPSRRPRCVAAFGIDPANAFGLGLGRWRYSLCSAMALPMLDRPRASRLLASARGRHFRTARLGRTAVLMGLLGLWYADFFGAQTTAVPPTTRYLERFPPISAADDRSNGEHPDRLLAVDVDTALSALGSRHERAASTS